MSESQRRFQRYDLNPAAFSKQRVKAAGLIGAFKGWRDCRVKDMSAAGALVLAKVEFMMGDKLEVELTTLEGTRLVFKGEVVNLGRDHSSHETKLGITLGKTTPGSSENSFLNELERRFKQSA
ncbi:PilZ domain-containing protein [Pseudomonas tritici]|uniref:PilZ domain-containing protein n=1 Tax=Pseudomonas tritici TaxID=2745518 RepID=UPI00387B3EDD